MNFPRYDLLSDEALKELHDVTKSAFDADENNPSPDKEYGVREFSDW
ncbi:MAG: hypothetical protein HQK83_14275, partial [Fibrobacteria bacterium]|nr:hypothetical protein [Fibrobacteria bacterium]